MQPTWCGVGWLSCQSKFLNWGAGPLLAHGSTHSIFTFGNSTQNYDLRLPSQCFQLIHQSWETCVKEKTYYFLSDNRFKRGMWRVPVLDKSKTTVYNQPKSSQDGRIKEQAHSITNCLRDQTSEIITTTNRKNPGQYLNRPVGSICLAGSTTTPDAEKR